MIEELQLKYIEIVFDKEKPQKVGNEIKISSIIDKNVNGLEYKYIVGKGGVWNTIQEFSDKNECTWNPKSEGEYIVMVQAREKNGKKSLDYLAKEDFSIVKEENINEIDKDIAFDNSLNSFDDEFNGEYSNSYEERLSLLGNKDIEVCDKVSKFTKNINSNEEGKAIEITREESKLLEDHLEDGTEEKNIDILKKDSTNLDNIKKSQKIIDNVIVSKENIVVGDKYSIEVKPVASGAFLYRFYIKRYNDWDIVRDYTIDNMLRYTATEEGEKEFLIQCKQAESTENFNDYTTIKVQVKEREKVEIINFKSLNKELIKGEELKFKLETNNTDYRDIVYKFYKISKEGKSICIQDYSTKNSVSYVESQEGEYRILCLVKDILSNKEYDDRAIVVYNVKPYRDVKIKDIVVDLNSPQASETEIKIKAEADGGKKLLYRYNIKGPMEEDTGFIKDKEYIWNPKEPGNYEIIVYVKDKSYNGEYEATSKIDFMIEKRGSKPVKILDVVVDKEQNSVIGQPVNIMVNSEGGTHLKYGFKISKNKKILENIAYNKSNWMNFTPNQAGDYEIEIMVKDKYSQKTYDAHTIVYLKVMEYLPGEIDYIIMPYKDNYLVGDPIEFECIIQNTNSVIVRYETKINGHSIEKTDFQKNKKLRFIPKISGKYTIEVYAKNIKCTEEYDCKKEVNIYVSEAAPIINTKIIVNKSVSNVNEELTFEAISYGGKEVCYEFYLMENNEWRKVQPYSRKHYYSFIPFTKGKYKILALAKSYYKKVSYEDYDEVTFEVKDINKQFDK